MFITFEGPEGSGKSSQIALLSAWLQQQGFAVVQTREPGGTPIGDQIRACLHDVDNVEMTAVTEVLLYSASRAQLVEQVIRPALAAGKVVLCDRFADSTLAYQGYGRGLNLDDLQALTRIATGGLVPDLTILLDIDVARGLERRRVGGQEMNRLDLEALAFHERVRAGYHALAAAEPERWVVVNADQPVANVQAEIRRVVVSRLEQVHLAVSDQE
ncbi:MAG: dTMP kinase [Chloroflexi bacterium]|nr:MAG: dTMP kinase [Chloroflexota bacterium]